MQFRKINDLKKQNPKNIVAFIKFGVAMSAILPLITVLFINVFMHENHEVELFYSFYISIKDETKGVLIRFCTSLLIYSFQFTFPCLICVMCAILFYNFSLLIGCFCEDLQALTESRNVVHRCSILSKMKLHTSCFTKWLTTFLMQRPSYVFSRSRFGWDSCMSRSRFS